MRSHADNSDGWFAAMRRQRGKRALERQLDYQEAKAKSLAGGFDDLRRSMFVHSQLIRQKLERIRPISENDKLLEVGSGAHGLIFGFGANFAVGIDPLAVDYRRLFPKWQESTATIAANGAELPFDEASFDVVLSDNVIDHAEKPLRIVDEIVRVLRPGGLLYFTVNVHHPFYELVSKAHGAWNAMGLKFEVSPFADHTVHFSEEWIGRVFAELPLTIVSQSSTVAETKAASRQATIANAQTLIRKMFFKNAHFEVVAVRD